jgi:hypothetical protein
MELIWNPDEAIVPSHTKGHPVEEAAIDDGDAADPLVAQALQGDRGIREHEIAPDRVRLLREIGSQLKESRSHVPDAGDALLHLDECSSMGSVYTIVIQNSC